MIEELKLIDLKHPDIIDKIKHIFISADTHFGHNRVITDCNRPTTIEEHDDWLIDRINSVVGKKDKFYLLGDISFHNKKETDKILDKIHGEKYLIIGNHDKSCENSTRFITKKQIYNFTFSEGGLNIHIVMCHFPIASWERKIYHSYNAYGHCHSRFPNTGLSHDVGLDNNNWYPINLYEFLVIMNEKIEKILAGEHFINDKLENIDWDALYQKFRLKFESENSNLIPSAKTFEILNFFKNNIKI